MTKDEDFKLLKIQTCVLKVNIYCDGCRQKVKKLLQRIEGVYQVIIDAEQQKVTVSGSVDSATLIKKLVRAGKHTELWSQKGNNQNQKQKGTCIKDDKNNKGQKQYVMKNLEFLKDKQKFPFLPKEDDDCDDEEYDEDEDEELQLLRDKINQMTLSKQKSEANNPRKSIGTKTSGSNNPGKKGNPNQNMMTKGNLGGIDQKTLTALKMNNAQFTGANLNHAVDGRKGNDISTVMNLTGFHGNGAKNMSSDLGGNHNGIVRGVGGLQIQPYNVFQGNSGGYPVHELTAGHDPSSMTMNMNGYPSWIALHQQPQMKYNRSPFIPPSTGYYYNYGSIPYTFTDPGYGATDHSSTHMFSDENTSSCAIM